MTTLAEYCHIEVLNTGFQPTTLINMEATIAPKAGGLQIGYSSVAFVAHVGSRPLPALLSPGEMWSARLEMGSLEGLAKHGLPIIRVRASHNKKPIDTALAMKPHVAPQLPTEQNDG